MRQLVVHGAGPAADVVGREAELDATAAAVAPECLPAALQAAAGWAELSCNRVVGFHGADPEEDVR